MKNILLYIAIICAVICLTMSTNISDFMFTSLVISIVHAWYHLTWKKAITTDENKLQIFLGLTVPFLLVPFTNRAVAWTIFMSFYVPTILIVMAMEYQLKRYINS